MADNKVGKLTTNRTSLLLVGIGAFGVLIAIGAAVYLVLLRQPSADDYAQATKVVEEVGKSYEKISAAATASAEQTRSSGKLDSTEELTQSINEYKQNVNTLLESNVTLDNDVDKAMDAFKQDAMKQPLFIEGRTHAVNASILCEPMFAQQGNVIQSSRAARQSKEYSNQCIGAVEPLESSSISEFRKFGKDLKDNAQNRIEYIERFWGIFTIFNKDQQKVDSIEKEIRDVAKVIQPPDLEELSKEYDTDAAFKLLKDTVSAKSRNN